MAKESSASCVFSENTAADFSAFRPFSAKPGNLFTDWIII